MYNVIVINAKGFSKWVEKYSPFDFKIACCMCNTVKFIQKNIKNKFECYQFSDKFIFFFLGERKKTSKLISFSSTLASLVTTGFINSYKKIREYRKPPIFYVQLIDHINNINELEDIKRYYKQICFKDLIKRYNILLNNKEQDDQMCLTLEDKIISLNDLNPYYKYGGLFSNSNDNMITASIKAQKEIL